MTDIQRTCPACQSILEVPGDSIGKQAQCPACQHVFRVAAAEDLPAVPLPPAVEPASTHPPTSHPPPFSRPDASRPERYQGEDADNPYAPASRVSSEGSRPLAPVQVRTPEPADFINATWSLFQVAWRPLVGAGAVALLLNSGSTLLGLLLSIAAQESGNVLFVLLNIGIRLLLTLAYFFVTLGILRMSVDLARGYPIRFAQTFQTSGRAFGFSLLGSILFLLPFLIVLLPILLAGIASGFDAGLMALAGVVCMLPMVILVMALLLYLWPYVFFIVDREAGPFESLRQAYQVGRVNKLNTLILMLLSMGLGSAGVCACYIGQVASIPATMLLSAVAYLQMTGQPIVIPASPTHAETAA